ncbi:MAG: GNAT family N-acetyltransferase [Ignavibacteriae bacterium]|nr:GNAT family N-acetyltransferase [Ignavibacteriota bacterium]
MNIKIRKSIKQDSKEVIRLIKELADFEKLDPPDSKAIRNLIKDMYSKNSPVKVIVAETDGRLIGYAFYFYTYSTFLAKKTLYLEDVYVSSDYRKSGVGKMFFKELMKAAKKSKCGRMEWHVLDWNVNAIRFYKNLAAEELKEWKYFRMSL